MKVGDTVVLEMGIGPDEHYQIGRVRLRDDDDGSTADTPFTLDPIGNDHDRTTAFDKARKAAGDERTVHFTQYGRPGLLQAEFNDLPCPKCGVYTKGFDVITLDNGAVSHRCHACKHPIQVSIIEP